MAGKDFTAEERSFLKDVGLDTTQLEPLVADAPSLPQDVLERIRSGARAKAGAASASVVRPSPRLRRFRPWLAAAAALLIGGGVALSQSDGAMAAIRRLVRLVPGIGLTEADAGTLVLTSPVSVEQDGQQLTITGLVSSRDGTELRYEIEGLSLEHDDANIPGYPFRSVLRLADGTRLAESTMSFGAADGIVSGVIWFAPLPHATDAFTFAITPVGSSVAPFEVTVPVVDAGAAGLPEAVEGGWSEERLGVRIGVPHWTVQGDRILLNLETALPEGSSLQEVGESLEDRGLLPVLTDDLGRTYPLIAEESQLYENPGQPVSLVFQGPLLSEVRTLRLTVPALRIADQNAEAASLNISVDQLAAGDTLQLGRELELGAHRFTVEQVTRLDDLTFRFDLDLGPEQDGVLLQEVGIKPAHPGRAEGWGRSWVTDAQTGQMTSLEFYPEVVRRGHLDVQFTDPVLRLMGNWEVTIPLEAEDSGVQ